MLDSGKMLGLVAVADRDHTCKAGTHLKMAWVTVSYGSPHLGQ